jgi:hypothetical protein
MTARAIKTVAPFAFRSDFGPQPEDAAPDEPARVSFTGEEVAGLIAQVRAETLAEVAQRQAVSESERLTVLAQDLRAALGEIVQVMSHIEAVQFDAATEARLRGAVEAAAGRVIRGQADLFETLADTSAPAPKEGTT